MAATAQTRLAARRAAWFAAALAWAAALLCLGLPAGIVLLRVAEGLTQDGAASDLGRAVSLSGAGWQRLGLTLGVAALIGTMAAVLALGPACLLARAGRSRAVLASLIAAPVLLPAWLSYSGWGLLRAPLSPGARWLEALSATWLPDAPVLAGRALAIGGLALWSWPIAVVVATPMLSRIDRSLLDEARLSLSRAPRARLYARLALAPTLSAAGVVGVIMLGSAVPLHLAQIQTDAIRLWRLLDQTSASHRWTAWVGAWPSVLLAVAAAGIIGRALVRGLPEDSPRPVGTDRAPPRRRAWLVAWTLLLWGLSVAVPLALFLLSLRDAQSLGRFWRLHADAALHSGAAGAAVGLLACLLAASIAITLGTPGVARAARPLLPIFLAGAVLPGVLVGSATLDAWAALAGLPGLAWLTDSPAIVVAVHLARYGALAALVGVVLARAEASDLASLRAVHGATGLRDWARTRPPGVWAALAGVGVASALLSIHEIESAVIVQPVGMQSLSRHMLALLHFARDEELSAASVWLIALGAAPAALACLGLLVGLRGRPADARPSTHGTGLHDSGRPGEPNTHHAR